MKSQIVFGLMGLGLLMVALSFIWLSLFPGTSGWTTEKAERWGEVKNRLHNLAFIVNAPPGKAKMHGGPDLGAAKAEYEQLKKENEQLNAEFSGAYNAPRSTATVLKWGGIFLSVVGVIGWYAVKNSS